MNAYAIAALGVGGLYLIYRRSRPMPSSKPLSIADLNAIDARPGNDIPEHLRPVALGLGVVAGELLGMGERITTAYRNDEYNAAVGGVPSSFHRLAQALDIGGAWGEDDPDEQALLMSKMRAHPLIGPTIHKLVPEHDHLHCEFDHVQLIRLAQIKGLL